MVGIRTFCVIPHPARSHPSFEAVHENQIMFNSGKLSTFHFSHVLSPAHNLTHNIIGPLLDSIRSKENCSLLISSPESEDSFGVALDLYSNLLPLMFRVATTCAIAHVSVVEIRKDGRTMVDLYRMCKVATLQDLDTDEVLRSTADTHWGTVMELLSQRGPSSTGRSLGRDSSVFVRIFLEGYCTVVVGDLGVSSPMLNLATLVLRSGLSGESRTLPPRVPFTHLLSQVVPPNGLVHVVCIPDPHTDELHSLRCLHFASHLKNETITLFDANDTSAMSSSPPRPLISPRRDGRKMEKKVRLDHSTDYHWRDDLIAEVFGGAEQKVSKKRVLSASPRRHHESDDAVPVVLHDGKRERRLTEKLISSDRIIKEQQQQILALQAELQRARDTIEEKSRALKLKTDQLHALEDSSLRGSREKRETADLIERLSKRVEELENNQSKEKREAQDLRMQNQELNELNKNLQKQLQHASRKLRDLDKRQTAQARENVLANLSQSRSARKNARPPSPTLTDSALEMESLLESLQKLRSKSHTLESENRDLRLKLDQEAAYRSAVNRLGHFNPPEEPSRVGDSNGIVSSFLQQECESLRQQVQFFTHEMSRVQRDKDTLQGLLSVHPRTVELTDTILAVVRSMVSGCSSLIVQLQVLAAEEDAAFGPHARGSVAHQHIKAISELKDAIEEIASRKSTASSAIPSTAMASDCELISQFLTFEVERLTHLRAFIPTFAQLGVAVEHLKMRRQSRQTR